MNYKSKLLIFKTLNLLLVLSALVGSYVYFHKAYMSFLEKDIAAKIDQGKKSIREPLFDSQQHFQERKPTFKAIHKDALALYRNAKKHSQQTNTPVDLESLKNTLKQKHPLTNTDIHLFLIDRTYKVFDSTYHKDIGFDLSVFPETVNIIDLAFSNNQINLSELISRDPLDMNYKMYAYAKADEDTLLELGFIDSHSKMHLFNALNTLSPDLSATLYHIIKDDDGNLFYFPVKENNTATSKETLYSSRYRFKPNDPKRFTDPVIQAFLQNKRVMRKTDNAYHVYANVYDVQDADVKTEYEKIVLKFDINTTAKQHFLSSIQTIFILTAMSSLMILFALYKLIKREIEHPFEIITNHIKGQKKIPLQDLPNNHDDFHAVASEYNQLYDKFSAEVQKNADLLLVDHLTQIQNRKAFDIKIQELLNQYYRYKHPFSMFMFDIDNFKKINDSLGHHAGDQLLRDFSLLIKNSIRECDFFYRTGGEEFVVLFPDTDSQGALVVSEEIRQYVEAHFADIRQSAITISGGLCTVKPYDTQDTLFKCADQLLYQAKSEGKNRIETKFISS